MLEQMARPQCSDWAIGAVTKKDQLTAVSFFLFSNAHWMFAILYNVGTALWSAEPVIAVHN